MIRQEPPQSHAPVTADTGIASTTTNYHTQVMHRFNGATYLTPACADIADLVQTMDTNAIKNTRTKATRDDLRAP